MASYLRRSIEGFSRKATSMTNLLKNGAFIWDSLAQESFERVNFSLINVPMLILLNFDLPFKIEMDTCSVGVGAMLPKGCGVISYESRKIKSS